MCSIHEYDQPERRVVDDFRSKLCMKCKTEEPVVVIRTHDPLCRGCFLQYCTHKFRSAFGKTRLVRDGEKALVAFSGGHSSTALLHLIQEGLSERAQKKLRFVPSLIHIDERIVTGFTDSSEDIEKIMTSSSFPCCLIPLEKVMSVQDLELKNTTQDIQRVKSNKSEEECFRKLLRSTKSLTAKEELIKRLRSNLLHIVAEKLGHTKIIVGDCCTHLSINLLSNMALGQGAHLPFETGFADTRDQNVLVIRPMREFTSKEVAFLNNLTGLKPHVLPTLLTKGQSNVSINRLTEEFVLGLQSKFPSTVSTIFRTGEKLDIVESEGQTERNESAKQCAVCKGPIDTNAGECSAMKATEFSETICKEARSDAIVNEDKSSSILKSMLEELCYGCRLLVRDMESINNLPSHILNELKTNIL